MADASLPIQEVDGWDGAQVESWLREKDHAEFCEIFAEQAITGRDLLEITDLDLRDFGVSAFGTKCQTLSLGTSDF